MPRDKRRGLPVPDAMHQLKSALTQYKGNDLIVIVEREQEAINLGKIARHRGFRYRYEKDSDTYRIHIQLKG